MLSCPAPLFLVPAPADPDRPSFTSPAAMPAQLRKCHTLPRLTSVSMTLGMATIPSRNLAFRQGLVKLSDPASLYAVFRRRAFDISVEWPSADATYLCASSVQWTTHDLAVSCEIPGINGVGADMRSGVDLAAAGHARFSQARRADMDRRTMLKLGGLALAGLGVDGCATTQATTQAVRSTPERPAGPARAPLNLAPVRASLNETFEPRSACARTAIRICPEGGEVRRQDRLPRLRARRRRHVAGLGHGRNGERHGARDRPAARGRARVRVTWPHGGQAAATARLRCHHHAMAAALHDVEHVGGGFLSDLRAHQRRQAHAGVGRAVPAGGPALVSAAAAAVSPYAGSRGSIGPT